MQPCMFLFLQDSLCSPQKYSYITWDTRTNNTKVRELQGSSCWKRGSVAHDDSWCPGGCFLVHHQWAKWKQKLPSSLNCDSWKWPYRDSSGLLNKFYGKCFKVLSPLTADVVEISNKVNLPPQTRLKRWIIFRRFSSETEPESPKITFLSWQMYWRELKRKLPVRSCWANFLLGVDETLKSPLQAQLVSDIIRNTNA